MLVAWMKCFGNTKGRAINFVWKRAKETRDVDREETTRSWP